MTLFARRLLWIIPAICFFCLITLAFIFPAQWVASWLNARSGGQVVLRGAQGSIWNGSVNVALTYPNSLDPPIELPGRLSWKLAALPLFSGKFDFLFENSQLSPNPIQLLMNLRDQTLLLNSGQLLLPISTLSILNSKLRAIQPSGKMYIKWSDLQLKQNYYEGQAVITMTQLSSILSRANPLGDYRIAIQARALNIQFSLSTLTGLLYLNGQGSISPQASFKGLATASPESGTALSSLLLFLGSRDGRVAVLNF